MNSDSNTTILLNIYERLGAIESQLKSLTKAHEDTETDVKELKRFESRVGAYIWIGGSIASGVLFFLWEGLKYLLEKWLH